MRAVSSHARRMPERRSQRAKDTPALNLWEPASFVISILPCRPKGSNEVDDEEWCRAWLVPLRRKEP